MVLPVAIGFATGIVAYNLTQNLVHLYAVSAVVGVIFFVLGIFLSLKLLSLVTVVFGSLIFFNVFVFFHVPSVISAVAAIVIEPQAFGRREDSENLKERNL